MSLAAYLITYGAVLLGLIFVAAYFFFSRKYDHWKKKGVKHLKPLPFVGNLKDTVLGRKNFGMVASEIYEKHKEEPYIGWFAFNEPVLLIQDLDLVKAVLVKDFSYFYDRTGDVDEELNPLNARNLFGLRGDRWRNIRHAITPSFTSGKMKRMYVLVAECGKLLVLSLNKEINDEQPVAVYEVAARYTTDVIASCAFGIQGNTLSDPEAEFRRILKRFFDFSAFESLKIAFAFLAPKLVKTFGLKLVKPEVETFMKDLIASTIKERKQRKIKRNDLLESLLELREAGWIANEEGEFVTDIPNKTVLEDIDVVAHSTAFLAAGFETSATTMTYMMYELAQHGDVQQKLREEIQEALSENDDQLSYETLHGLKYLDMVLQETLRKYPPVPFLSRLSSKDYKIPGTEIGLEKDSRIVIPVFGFQRDPRFFPNPKHFDPERFSEENKKKITNYTFLPFGEGPRSCVGLRFALMQSKNGIAHIIKNYSLEPCSLTPAEIEFKPRTFLLQPKEKIHLLLKKLH